MKSIIKKTQIDVYKTDTKLIYKAQIKPNNCNWKKKNHLNYKWCNIFYKQLKEEEERKKMWEDNTNQ